MGGMNPQHAIVNGLGASPNDSVGYPWTVRYTIASGNLLADFRANLNAESQGRLQVVRLYEMTSDHGVRDMLSFLIARDTMHQNQWLAAIAELEEKEGKVNQDTWTVHYYSNVINPSIPFSSTELVKIEQESDINFKLLFYLHKTTFILIAIMTLLVHS